MSGTTPTPGSEPDDGNNPYAQPGDTPTPPLSSEAPPYGAPADPPAEVPPYGTPPEQPAGTAPAWSGTSQDPMTPESAPQPPKPILTAVKLMYVGAAIQLISVFFTLASREEIRDAVIESDTGLSDADVDTAVNVAVGVGVGVSVLGVLLWLWMASANKKGRSWARVVATVLGGLNIVFTLYSLSSGGGAGVGVLVNVVSIALAAVILWLLYRPESTEYYAAVKRNETFR